MSANPLGKIADDQIAHCLANPCARPCPSATACDLAVGVSNLLGEVAREAENATYFAEMAQAVVNERDALRRELYQVKKARDAALARAGVAP